MGTTTSAGNKYNLIRFLWLVVRKGCLGEFSLARVNRLFHRQPPRSQKLATYTTRLLRLPEVMRRVSLSKATIYRLMLLGKFPRPRKIECRAVGWFEDEIDDFLARIR